MSIDPLLVRDVEIISRATITVSGLPTKNIANVYTFWRTTNTNPVVKANVESAFNTAIMTPVLASLNASYGQVSNDIRILNDALDPYLSVPRAAVGGVGSTGTKQQNYDSVFLEFVTSVRGRFARGGKHYSPLDSTETVGDVLTAGAIILFDAVKTALIGGFSDLQGNNWLLTVVSRLPSKSQLKTNPTTVYSNPVTSINLDKTTGTMRRRKARTIVV